MKRIAIVAILLAASANSAAQSCTRSEIKDAENKIYTLNSWQSIYDFYKTYGLCDDGGIAEGTSDRTVHLLATQWETLSQVKQIIAQDPTFETFFLKQINASADTLELDLIVLSASQQCLPQDWSLCMKIAEAASER